MRNAKAELPCEFCKNPAQFFTSRLSWNYYRCTRCRLLFLSPIPTFEQLQNLYSAQGEVESGESKKLARLIFEVENLVSDSTKEHKILDIGSQNGTFLSHLQSVNRFELFGVEPSKEGFLKSSQNPKLNIKNGFFTWHDYQPSSFDFVNLGDVIEHLENPIEMIADVKKILTQHGHFIISTPITDCPYVKTSNFFHKILGDFFPAAYLTPPYHIRYFTSRSLDDLLLDQGFVKTKSWYFPSNFLYELAQSEILLGFRSRTLAGKFNPVFLFKLGLFTGAYLLSKFGTLFSKKDFSYTAIYQVKD